MKNISIGHEPVYINTPYGTIYIECAEWSEAKPELIVGIFDLSDSANLCLSVSDQQEEYTIDTSTTKAPNAVMPPIKDIDTSKLKTPKPIIDKAGNLL